MLKLNGLMMGLNIKKDSGLISLEGEVREDGQDNAGAHPAMQFNIIYIMRTHVVLRGFWRFGLVTWLLWPTIPTPVAHTVERIRFSAGHKPPSFSCRPHCHCRLLLSDTMMFAQKSLNTQCLIVCSLPAVNACMRCVRLPFPRISALGVPTPAKLSIVGLVASSSADVMDCH
ncbi:hypothetical protein [Serratia ureilytica]|uniref:hypothetical protein n=1 Tax=Serratia ureilytica TaxID=300181 RepID=UPI001D196933|nr:hypothetical protein [Serratia ureilytica]MCC4106120.1 hypothetical protein [Serratia ureilytica]